MGKPDDNLCKQALLEGQKTCNNEDLLTECVNMCERLKVKCVSKGEPNAKEKLEIKKALWRENDKEIKEALMKSERVQNTKIHKTEKERNCLKRMNLPDARTWFRYWCKTTKYIKEICPQYTTHSTYKWPYPFQAGPMQKFYRILTSRDPMHVLLTVI